MTTAWTDGVRRIVVGLDGSAAAAAGVAAAVTIAAHFGAQVVGVHATGLLDVWRVHEDGGDPTEGIAEQLRGPWSEALRTSGITYRLEQRNGPPADVMLAVADEVDADLIVVGSRGTGDTPLGELGSTSGKIVRRSGRAVLVVPDANPDPS
ncbi:MAG: universal stress protein [Ilumatobacteraceae bacterium]